MFPECIYQNKAVAFSCACTYIDRLVGIKSKYVDKTVYMIKTLINRLEPFILQYTSGKYRNSVEL